jgi:putative transcriptional regulator
MIRFTPSSVAEPKPGQVLLSEPFLEDVYFGRKAVLLCEHNKESSFGFVLNNFIEVDLHELLQDMPQWEARISLGGPVKNSNLYYLHTCRQVPDATQVMEGLYMGGDFDWIKQAVLDQRITDLELRFFVGYAGWTSGQLADEIKSKSWFVVDASMEKIMDTTIEEDDYWKQLILAMGPEFTHIANAPTDPSLN